jgi:hypothetical protein
VSSAIAFFALSWSTSALPAVAAAIRAAMAALLSGRGTQARLMEASNSIVGDERSDAADQRWVVP